VPDPKVLAARPIPARLIRNESQPRGVAAVDQVLRNAIGVEVQESLTITPVDVPTTRLTDALLSRPHFFMVRVQAADLSIVEQRIGLLDPLALGILGIQSGDEVVIQGAPGADGKVAELRICVHAIPPETASRREHLAGGGATARFPSASDMLAVYPDLPWLFLDAASRASLGVDSKLSVVRVRASRRFQLIREFRELLLVLVLATVGVATVVESTPVLAILLVTVAAAAVAVARSRLKRRLESP
jgi:hypothetical protein